MQKHNTFTDKYKAMKYTVSTKAGARQLLAFSAWVGPRHFQDLEPDTLAAMLAEADNNGATLCIQPTGVVDAKGLPCAGGEEVGYLYNEAGGIIWGRLTAVATMLLRAAGGDVANLAGPRHKDARARLMSELTGRKVPVAKAGVTVLRERLYELAKVPADTWAGKAAHFRKWLDKQPPPVFGA